MAKILNRWTGAEILDTGGAYLGGAYLCDAYLCDAYLGGADLRGAYLGGADLRGAYLGGADLRGAYLGGADLCDANLRDANLRDADLRDADLRGAYLGGADLRGAYLRGIREALGIEYDPSLPGRVVKQITEHPETHDQSTWHTECGTRHCVAGWATTLSGALGKFMDRQLGTSVAATLLLWREGCEMPSFAPDATEAETIGRLRALAVAAEGDAK